MHKLEFINKIYGEKVNYTVRDGDKWANRVEVNDVIEIDVPIDEDGMMVFDDTSEDSHPFSAVVTEVGSCAFEDLPERVYRFEHDPVCSNRDGLEKAMKRAYDIPEDEWEGRLVTYVGFIIMEIDDEDD